MVKTSFFLLEAFLFAALGLSAQDQTGVASFYGDEFTGRKTSSGVPYDPGQFTAAHLTLPFGTQVEVTNLSNGLKTTVTVNDRGPWVKGRLIDLSRVAAEALKIDGLAQVSIHPTGSVPTPDTGNQAVYFQVGSYRILANAQTRASALEKSGFTVEIWTDGILNRVFVLRQPKDGTEGLEPGWMKLSGPPQGKAATIPVSTS